MQSQIWKPLLWYGQSNVVGGISLHLCETFTTATEGAYSCIMMNSSMMEQTMRAGVHFSGRSESLDMYPIWPSCHSTHRSLRSQGSPREYQ